MVERGELAPSACLQPLRRFEQRVGSLLVGIDRPLREGDDRAAHRVRIEAVHALGDGRAFLRQHRGLFGPPLPEMHHRILVEHRNLTLVASALDRRDRLPEAGMGLVEPAHVAEREALAGERIGEDDRRPVGRKVAALLLDRLVEQRQRRA